MRIGFVLFGALRRPLTPASLRIDALSQVRAGSIKAYAIMDKSRIAAAPDIPTVDEAGLGGVGHLAGSGFARLLLSILAGTVEGTGCLAEGEPGHARLCFEDGLVVYRHTVVLAGTT